MAKLAASFEQPTWKQKLVIRAVDADIHPLAPADIHATLAFIDYLFLDAPDRFARERRDRAERHVGRALEMEPGNIVANAIASSAPLPIARVDRTADVIRAHRGDWRAWVLRAAAPNLPQAELVTAANAALQLAPHRREALELAAVSAVAQGLPDAATAYADKAQRLAPTSPRPRALQIVAAERQSRCADVQRLLADKTNERRLVVENVRRIRAQLALADDHCPWTFDGRAPGR